MELTGSYADVCCGRMQEAIREHLVEYVDKNTLYLASHYQVNDGDGHIDLMTDRSMKLHYCSFCGKKLEEE